MGLKNHQLIQIITILKNWQSSCLKSFVKLIFGENKFKKPELIFKFVNIVLQINCQKAMTDLQKIKPCFCLIFESMKKSNKIQLTRLFSFYENKTADEEKVIERIHFYLQRRKLSFANWRQYFLQKNVKDKRNKNIDQFFNLVTIFDAILKNQIFPNIHLMIKMIGKEFLGKFETKNKQNEFVKILKSINEIVNIAKLKITIDEKLKLAVTYFYILGLRIQRLRELIFCINNDVKIKRLQNCFNFLTLSEAQLLLLSEYTQLLSKLFKESKETNSNSVLTLVRHITTKNNCSELQREKTNTFLSSLILNLKNSINKNMIDVWNNLSNQKLILINSEKSLLTEFAKTRERVNYAIEKLRKLKNKIYAKSVYLFYVFGKTLSLKNSLELTDTETVSKNQTQLKLENFDMFMHLNGKRKHTELSLNVMKKVSYEKSIGTELISKLKKIQSSVDLICDFEVYENINCLINESELNITLLRNLFKNEPLAKLLFWIIKVLKRTIKLEIPADDHSVIQNSFKVDLNELFMLYRISIGQIDLSQFAIWLSNYLPSNSTDLILTVLAFENSTNSNYFLQNQKLLRKNRFFDALGFNSQWTWSAIFFKNGQLNLVRKLQPYLLIIGHDHPFVSLSELLLDLVEIRQVDSIINRNKKAMNNKPAMNRTISETTTSCFSQHLPSYLRYSQKIFLLLNCGDKHRDVVVKKAWKTGVKNSENFLSFYFYLNMKNFSIFKLEFVFDFVFLKCLISQMKQEFCDVENIKKKLKTLDKKHSANESVFDAFLKQSAFFCDFRKLQKKMTQAEKEIFDGFISEKKKERDVFSKMEDSELVDIMINKEVIAKWKQKNKDPEVAKVLNKVFPDFITPVPLMSYFKFDINRSDFLMEQLTQPNFVGSCLKIYKGLFIEFIQGTAVDFVETKIDLKFEDRLNLSAGFFILLISRKLRKLSDQTTSKVWRNYIKILIHVDVLFKIIDKASFFNNDGFFFNKFQSIVFYLLSMGLLLKRTHLVTFSSSLFTPLSINYLGSKLLKTDSTQNDISQMDQSQTVMEEVELEGIAAEDDVRIFTEESNKFQLDNEFSFAIESLQNSQSNVHKMETLIQVINSLEVQDYEIHYQPQDIKEKKGLIGEMTDNDHPMPNRVNFDQLLLFLKNPKNTKTILMAKLKVLKKIVKKDQKWKELNGIFRNFADKKTPKGSPTFNIDLCEKPKIVVESSKLFKIEVKNEQTILESFWNFGDQNLTNWLLKKSAQPEIANFHYDPLHIQMSFLSAGVSGHLRNKKSDIFGFFYGPVLLSSYKKWSKFQKSLRSYFNLSDNNRLFRFEINDIFEFNPVAVSYLSLNQEFLDLLNPFWVLKQKTVSLIELSINKMSSFLKSDLENLTKILTYMLGIELESKLIRFPEHDKNQSRR